MPASVLYDVTLSGGEHLEWWMAPMLAD